MSGASVQRHILTELAASLRAQERGIGQTLRAREIEAVAQWIESWTSGQTSVDDERRSRGIPRNRDTPCAVDGCTITSPLLRVNPKGELGIFMCPEHAEEVG